MAKRILITSTDLMMVQFLVPHVINLSENGFHVEIACSNVGGRVEEIRSKLKNYVKKIHIVRLKRSPIAPINFLGYQDMKQIINSGHFNLIWTNEPVMGVVTRLAARTARKNGTKVMYMTHGFHFFKGAPKKNWLIFYNIEHWASRLCDVITTINREDYKRAKKMHAPVVRYIHGIGINPERLSKVDNRSDIRQELRLNKDAFLCISVACCCLCSKNECSRIEIHRRIFLNLVVQIHHMKDVHELSLVLVKSLNLHIKDRIRIYINTIVLLDILC